MSTATTPLSDLPKLPTELADGVIGKVDLKKVETHEKNILPSPEDMAQEKQHESLLTGIENFSTPLKHTETEEKLVLPSSDDIKAEKQHKEFTETIESFTPDKLKNVETEEKNVLPSKEDLAREKSMDLAANFDKHKLKHVEPTVKTSVEVIDA